MHTITGKINGDLRTMKLYWVTTPGHEEDWFVVATILKEEVEKIQLITYSKEKEGSIL